MEDVMVIRSQGARQKARGRRQKALTAGLLMFIATFGSWSTSAQAPDPVLGTWELNVLKSRFSPGPPPRSESRTYAQDGTVIRATSKGVDAGGKPTGGQWTVTYDGTEQKIVGHPDADSQVQKSIDRFTTETTIKKAGKVVQTADREVSKDGKTMTLTFKGVNARGQTIHDVMVFEKR